MAERRYNDKEIAAIFRTAAEAQTNPPREVPADEGLTLSDLQAIGREVGIPADAVAHAAQAVDVRVGAASRTILGLPLQRARPHPVRWLATAMDQRQPAGAARTH